MRKTKIVCTLGPATDDLETVTRLMEEGMNVARLNFSHGTHKEHQKRIKLVRQAEANLEKPVSIMLDTQGPEVRIGDMEQGEVELKTGNEVVITTEDTAGTSHRIPITYDGFPEEVGPDSIILLDDGLIELKVLQVEGKEVKCRVINGGKLGSKKGVNLPGQEVNLPALTEKDREDIKFGIKHDIHFIAASFIRKASDIIEIRKLLENEWAQDTKIIAKIESQEAVNNIREIIEVADGVMIARGDLGVELPTEKVPVIQKQIISLSNRQAKPVITATQMLDSMIRNPRPTRAEASDVANAIYDGTDATMLSGETAIGNYPVGAVNIMDNIAREIENSDSYREKLEQRHMTDSDTVTEAISIASCEIARGLTADAIITATGSGYTARMVSKCRSLTPIVAVTPNQFVYHTLTLSWGIYPVLVSQSYNTDEMMDNAVKAASEHELINDGDLVTITAGVPVGTPGTTNLIKVDVVGDPVVEGKGVGGIVTGKARFVSCAEEALSQLEQGEILIARQTNKQFYPAMEKAAGIITGEGGLTSHAAVTGLKLGIPVVVDVPEIFELIEDKEVITIDGVRGLVYRGNAHIK